MNLSRRSAEDELMDNTNLDRDQFEKAFLDIGRCNRILGGNTITLKAVKRILNENPQDSYTIFDLGCGDGQLLRKLSNVLDEKGVNHQLVGYDLHQKVIDIAKSASLDYPKISFVQGDIFELNEVESCDIVLCTLTLHHFPEGSVQTLVTRMAQLARLGVVINDLQRSTLSYNLFKLFGLFFLNSQIAKNDGLISIKRGFRILELQKLAQKLTQYSHIIQWKWAFRYKWVIEPIKS